MRGVLAVVIAVVGTASAQPATQQDKSGKRKEADAMFEQARKLLADAGTDKLKVKAACDKFDEAIKLDPDAPGTMLNLGLCNEKLEKYKTALYWFRRAQYRAAETNLPDYEKAAKDHTVDLANKVATIKIAFSAPPPADAKVKIDGEEIAASDYLRAEVDPGHHTLTAGATGKKIVTQEFEVSGRGGDTITVAFVEGDNAVIVDRGRQRRRVAIYTAIGGGVVMGLSAVLTLAVWKPKYDGCVDNNVLKPDYDACTGVMNSSARDAILYANHYTNLANTWGTVIFAGGVAIVGVAAYLYFTAPTKERVDRTVLVPSVGPSHVGFSLEHTF